MSEITHYYRDAIPGGHECPHCGLLNTCEFVSGWFGTVGDYRICTETLACSTCGYMHEVVYTDKDSSMQIIGTETIE